MKIIKEILTKLKPTIFRFRVPSKSEPGVYHIVEKYEDGEYHCDCAGWRSAQKVGNDCSHIKKLKIYETNQRIHFEANR